VKVDLDTCLVIYRVEGAEPFSQAVAAAIRSAPAAVFCISDLVRLECLVGPIRSGNDALRHVYEAQFKVLPRVPLTSAVYDLAAELRAHTNLKVPDALHAAAAIMHGCDELWTNDGRFRALAPRIEVRVLLA
jgi:predicted nucleic acid-binding protein